MYVLFNRSAHSAAPISAKRLEANRLRSEDAKRIRKAEMLRGKEAEAKRLSFLAS